MNGCEGCTIYYDYLSAGKTPKPLEGDFRHAVEGRVEVLFVGHALNSAAVSPFAGRVGNYLRAYIKCYNVSCYGLTNIYKCRLGQQMNHPGAGSKPGKRCMELFVNELREYEPRLVVTLGSPASLVLTDKNVGELPSDIWHVHEMTLIALPHSTNFGYTNGKRSELPVWNRRWVKIAEYLKEVEK